MSKVSRILIFLVAVLLFAGSASAEYEQYRLTVGDNPEDLQGWEIFPLDAHNVIVRAYISEPWHVTWYQDGKVLRTLSSEGEWDKTTSPEPVFENGSFYMLCRIPEANPDNDPYPPPNATAQWTENGLTNIVPLTEQVKSTQWNNRIVYFETEQYQRIRYNGKDTLIPPKLAAVIMKRYCIALADEVFLMPYRDREAEDTKLLCLDHGNIRYRIDGSFRGRKMFPDGKQGFLSVQWDYVEWSSDRDLSPVRLIHVDGNGNHIRTYLLKSNQVYFTPSQSYNNPNTGEMTVYGSLTQPAGKLCAVFAMTLDADMNITGLEVRNIDPDYIHCEAEIYLAPNGFPWVYLYNKEHPEKIRPAVVPFPLLEQTDNDYGMTMQ